VRGDIFNKVEGFARELIPLIRKYGPERTAIIITFVRANETLFLLANYFSEWYMLPSYHQFKGNECDLVVVCGVDAGYFKFPARDLPDDSCPNTTFVALTQGSQATGRSSQRPRTLYALHRYTNNISDSQCP
jgi:hypothetical protein